jgi:hypothetical protein
MSSSLYFHQDSPLIKKQNARELFVEYFGDVLMTKLDYKNQYSFFYARIDNLMAKNNQFLVVITTNDYTPLSETRRLSELQWISFQTRTLDELPNKQMIKAEKIKQATSGLLTDKISLTSILNDRQEYTVTDPDSNLPIDIQLLYVPPKIKSYAHSGTVRSALDTYQCIINWKF